MGLKSLATRMAVVSGAAAAVLALTMVPAQAATQGQSPASGKHSVVQPFGWIGSCYATRGVSFAGGWCDGNGPDWVYRGFVDCTNGYEYSGVTRWAGDRRGSYGQCPSGTSSTLGGLDVFHNGVYQYSVFG